MKDSALICTGGRKGSRKKYEPTLLLVKSGEERLIEEFGKMKFELEYLSKAKDYWLFHLFWSSRFH